RRRIETLGPKAGPADPDGQAAKSSQSGSDEIFWSGRAGLIRRRDCGDLATPELRVRVRGPFVFVDAPKLVSVRIARSTTRGSPLVDDRLPCREADAGRMALARTPRGRPVTIYLEDGGPLDMTRELFLDQRSLSLEIRHGAAVVHRVCRGQVQAGKAQAD